MSKIGKKNIIIPKDSSVKSENGLITVTGPKGSKQLTINDKIFSVKVNANNEFNIAPLASKNLDSSISLGPGATTIWYLLSYLALRWETKIE